MICEEFCFTTRYIFLFMHPMIRQHFIDILEATRKTLNADDLVAALLKTIAFEKDLSDRFGEVEVIERTAEEVSVFLYILNSEAPTNRKAIIRQTISIFTF